MPKLLKSTRPDLTHRDTRPPTSSHSRPLDGRDSKSPRGPKTSARRTGSTVELSIVPPCERRRKTSLARSHETAATYAGTTDTTSRPSRFDRPQARKLIGGKSHEARGAALEPPRGRCLRNGSMSPMRREATCSFRIVPLTDLALSSRAAPRDNRPRETSDGELSLSCRLVSGARAMDRTRPSHAAKLLFGAVYARCNRCQRCRQQRSR